jgi:hypothetical protein
MVALAMGLAGLALAQTAPVIYPAKDQGQRQQDQDRFECHEWARARSGFDPSDTVAAAASGATLSTTPATSVATMAKGAAGGAAIAELSHQDVGRGAAAGLVGRTLVDRVKQRQAAQSQQQSAQQQQRAAGEAQRTAYARGFAACMEGRGYVLK